MATYKNLTIVIWATQATLPLVEHLGQLSETMIAAHPEGVSAIHVIQNGAPLPTAEARQQLSVLTNRYSPLMACAATLIGGEGFWASAMRGIVTSIHWLERRPFKALTCSTLEEIAAWLPAPHAERTHVVIGQTELLQVLSSVRGRVTRS
jgi:hypothetical protein